MSPRRRGGLSKADLEALEHLPAVLRALENLQEQHAKVRSLMGDAPTVRTVELDGRRVPAGNPESAGVFYYREGDHPPSPKSATLDTPERREHEAAKRAGRVVPAVDPFANASPAQRERMEEQKAFLRAQGRGRSAPTPEPEEPDEDAEANAATGIAVRTEPLETISDGTTPLAPDADEEVH